MSDPDDTTIASWRWRSLTTTTTERADADREIVALADVALARGEALQELTQRCDALEKQIETAHDLLADALPESRDGAVHQALTVLADDAALAGLVSHLPAENTEEPQ